MGEHPLGTLCGEVPGAADIDSQTVVEALARLFSKGHFVAVFDVPDREGEGQVGEGGVGFDFLEGAAKGCGRGVGLEGVQGSAVGRGGEGGSQLGGRCAREQGHGQVAVGGGGEDARDAGAGGGAGAEEDGEAGWFGGHAFGI